MSKNREDLCNVIPIRPQRLPFTGDWREPAKVVLFCVLFFLAGFLSTRALPTWGYIIFLPESFLLGTLFAKKTRLSKETGVLLLTIFTLSGILTGSLPFLLKLAN